MLKRISFSRFISYFLFLLSVSLSYKTAASSALRMMIETTDSSPSLRHGKYTLQIIPSGEGIEKANHTIFREATLLEPQAGPKHLIYVRPGKGFFDRASEHAVVREFAEGFISGVFSTQPNLHMNLSPLPSHDKMRELIRWTGDYGWHLVLVKEANSKEAILWTSKKHIGESLFSTYVSRAMTIKIDPVDLAYVDKTLCLPPMRK